MENKRYQYQACKRLYSMIAAVVLTLAASSVPAATSLSDEQLADISGAGISATAQNQALPQQPQQPQQSEQNDVTNPSLTPLPAAEGMELSPQILVILQSSASINRNRSLHLQQDTQRNVQALDLQNTMSSDAVSTNNIFNGAGLGASDITHAIEVNQVNDLSQVHRSQANLYSSQAGYSYESLSYQSNQSENHEQQNTISVYHQDQQSGITSIENNWNVAVDPLNWTSTVSQGESLITLWDSEPFFLIPGAGAGYIGSGLFGDSYGAEAYYSGLYVQGPTASVNHLMFYGPDQQDLLIDSTLRLGLIDFGYFKITGCVVACATIDADLGELEVLNVFDFLALVDPVIAPHDGIGFSSDGIILEGMGSAFSDELNLNSGLAFIGSGQVQILQPASFYSGGEFNFNADARLTLNLDLSGIDQLNLFGEWPKSWTIPAQQDSLIDFTIPFTLINIAGNTLDQQFNGELIVPLGLGDVNAGHSEQDNTDNEVNNNQDIVNVSGSENSSSEFSESYQYSFLVGGQMSGAQAELLSLSEGSLSVNKCNSIQLSDNVQQNARIFNGVNAVSSVAANAVNISRPPILTGATAITPQLSTQQHNLFVQRK